MAPENTPLEKEIPIGNHHSLGAMLVSGRVNVISKYAICGSYGSVLPHLFSFEKIYFTSTHGEL